MSNFDSLVKRPIFMISNADFKNIKRVQLKNNAYYVDNKKDKDFESNPDIERLKCIVNGGR